MSSTPTSPPKTPRRTTKARINGDGAVAQGEHATSVGKKAVAVTRDNHAPIHTGDIYQTLIQQAERQGASSADLRKAYLAWVCMRANELPLFAGDGGKAARLSSIYTALLTEAPQLDAADLQTITHRKRALAGDAAERQSALETLDREQHLVLMGGPGSGKSTFLNFVALCMAGEILRLPVGLGLLRAPIPAAADDRKKPRPQRWSHKTLLPVRVLLRDFAADLPPAGTPVTADTLWHFIVKQLPELIKPHAPQLQAELLQKGGLILLDGLDEVPDALQRRVQVKQAVQEFAGIYRLCRFLVTSRTYAYQKQDWKLDGFVERELLPFTRGQIEHFIDTWYAHMANDLFRLTTSDAQARAKLLKRATRRAELFELAERPLLLTLMVRLQTKGGGALPENREELYAQSVNMLLDEWEGLKLQRDANNGQPLVAEPSLSEWLGASQEKIRQQLDKLACDAHANQLTLVGTADIRQCELIDALMAAAGDKPDTRPGRLIEYLHHRAGLLTSHGNGLYQFPHRSFQEYLAACHLLRFDFPDSLSRLVKADPNRWREVTLLAAARARDAPSLIWELVDELCANAAPAQGSGELPDAAQWGALLAGQVLADSGLAAYDAELKERHENKRLRVRDWQLRLLSSTLLPARERVLAGDLLAQLGDPRAHLLDVEQLRFSLVPGGPFWMGGALKHNQAEPQLESGLDYDYWIAQTPVSVAQFRQFASSTENPQLNPGSLQGPENRPVMNVSLHDAQAFCTWLSERWRSRLPAGWFVALPLDAEWEKAARGGERIPMTLQATTAAHGFSSAASTLQANPLPRRAYPWGEDFVADHANVEMAVGGGSTPGCFAAGRSPYDCEDMSGNIWEWTRTPLEDEQSRYFVRGGVWGLDRNHARCAFSFRLRPNLSSDGLGFRVVLRSAPV